MLLLISIVSAHHVSLTSNGTFLVGFREQKQSEHKKDDKVKELAEFGCVAQDANMKQTH